MEHRQSITSSLNTDAINFPIENGRRYHAYQADAAKYLMPNDDDECDRLDFFHAIFYKSLGDRLFLAPLDEKKLHRALDLGTGTV